MSIPGPNALDYLWNGIGLFQSGEVTTHALDEFSIRGYDRSCTIAYSYGCVNYSPLQARHHRLRGTEAHKGIHIQLSTRREHSVFLDAKIHISSSRHACNPFYAPDLVE